MEIDVLVNYDCVCGENPLWHPDEKRVYWTDIDTGRLFCFDPQSGRSEVCWHDAGRKVGGFTLQADGKLLLFMDKGTVAVLENGRPRPIIEDIPRELDNRFNDVIADPEGRVFCGVMSDKNGKGRLYRLERDLSYSVVVEEVGCSNGMGFTRDLKRMYYTDSWPKEIYVFDYDRATGSLSNRRTLVTKISDDTTCDGMTVDENGDIWSAFWGDGHVRQFSPQGQLKRAIKLPAKKISSCCFGGDKLEDLYLTTATEKNKVENDGALLRIRGLGVRGVPEFRSRIGL
jgi:D-xylono/L-arabinono-1,4-lactonase